MTRTCNLFADLPQQLPGELFGLWWLNAWGFNGGNAESGGRGSENLTWNP